MSSVLHLNGSLLLNLDEGQQTSKAKERRGA